MIEDLQRRSYQLRSILLVVVVVAAVTAVSVLGSAFTVELNSQFILRFPLGFYLAAQGAIVIFVVMVFWAIGRQELLDRKYGAGEEN